MRIYPPNRPHGTTTTLGRRPFLLRIVALAAAVSSYGQFTRIAGAQAPAAEQQKFDFEWLRAQARERAGQPYQPPRRAKTQAITKMPYDRYQKIRFRPERALWAGEPNNFRIQFFHLGHYFQHAVDIYEVAEGVARPVHFSKELFDYGDLKFDPPLPDDLGFAGFKLYFHTDPTRDMASFLGASYFRAVGGTKQYGISARGLAVDTALSSGEEFPNFVAFWIERPKPNQGALTVCALLDSPSVSGAYRFIIHPARTTIMNVEASLFPRRVIKRLGLAPLTSMYQHGENDDRVSNDFRPEVHDSDGLAVLRGNGERIWRPLINPAELRVNTFGDENPRGFGLLQRDRNFSHYQDDGSYYDRRPNLWVVPQGDWGRGSVHLVEIPTQEEIFDNIVAFWTPEKPPEAGKELRLAYDLHWGGTVPDIYWPVAHVIATRSGIGGIPGQSNGRDSRKFVIDFSGGPLELLTKDARVEAVITASRGEVVNPAVRPIEELNGWRTNFDLKLSGSEPADLRCYLRLGGTALTETWIYQWIPPG